MTCDHQWRMLDRLRTVPVSDRKARLIGLGCCGYPRLFSDPRLVAFADAIERFAEGTADRDEVRRYRDTAIAEPCGAGTPLSTYDREVLCLDEFAGENAVEATIGFLHRLVPHAEDDPGIGRWVRLTGWCDVIRDVIGNPSRPIACDPAWRTSDVLALAEGIYDDRAFDRMPILADALQEAGCDSDDVLNHCRGGGPHVRGCWVVDLVLGKA
jgi:hypothetical protein